MSHLKSKNEISRRQFAKGALAVGASAYATSSGVFNVSKARADTPKRGGTVRYALESSSPNDTLDPIKVTSNIDATRCFQLYNNLVRMGADLSPQPALANYWEANSEATEWTFELREGIEFHNGKKLTAADVVYSVKRHLGENTESRIKAYMAQIAEISADGDHVIKIKIASPNSEFPILFSSARAGIIPEGHTDFENAVGTGPFKVREFQPGIRSVFARHENYWQDSKPYVEAVETFSIPDPVARMNALLSGEIEAGNSLDANSVPLIDLAPNVELVAAKGGQMVYQVLMCDRPPTENVDFRLALKYLQDREKIVNVVYKGYAQIGNDHPIAPSDPMYCADLPVRPYDPDKAKFHLKKAGMEGATVEIYNSTTAGPGNVEQTLLFQQTAAAAGLTVQVRQTPPEGYWNHTGGKFPIWGSHWNARPTADLMYTTIHMTNSPANESMYFNENIDKLIFEARATLDEGRRKEIWCDLQKIIHEEGGDMVPCFADYLHGRASNLKGMYPHPMGGLSDQFSAESVWLDA